MPVTPTYPGVYVEEIPSGVRTITGVATSITAFIGRAKQGPTNRPVTINSFADFERTFGGLWVESAMSYAVRDFYLNGGSQAIIVRLFHPNEEGWKKAQEDAANAVAKAAGDAKPKTGTDAEKANKVADAASAEAQKYTTEPGQSAANQVSKAAQNAAAAASPTIKKVTAAATAAAGKVDIPLNTKAQLKVGDLKLEAANEGAWGNKLQASVDHEVKDDDQNLFNLSIQVGTSGPTEQFRNVSVDTGSSRRVDKVLKNQSSLVRVQVDGNNKAVLPTARPEIDLSADPKVKHSILSRETSDGTSLVQDDFTGTGFDANKKGLYALEHADLFNLLCIPPYKNCDVDTAVTASAAKYCKDRRAMLIVDPPSSWSKKETAKSKATSVRSTVGDARNNAALFFPRLKQPNPLKDNQVEEFAPCGAVAGVFARTDTQRGVWKAPAGLDATLTGVPQLSVPLTDAENGELNPLGINCLRAMPAVGRVIWGARTLDGDDRLASEWKYIPVRRVALFIEESLYRGTQWVVFEPNDEPLWAQIRLNLGAFMHNMFRQGAFQGKTPREAYFVKCDKETTTQNDINLGIVNIVVGFAPLKPAEFVIIKLQQMAGQIET